jgi:hypothetical protein
VAIESIQTVNGNPDELGANKETLYMLGGVALMIFGAGLVLSNPTVRRFIGQLGIGGLAQAALPDMERYWKLRNM